MSALSIECTIQKLIILSFEKVMVDSPKGCEGPSISHLHVKKAKFQYVLAVRTKKSAYAECYTCVLQYTGFDPPFAKKITGGLFKSAIFGGD